MKIFFTGFFLLKLLTVIAQENQETYLFAEDIYNKIEKDTMSWKYQIGATEFSFIGKYADVISAWDKNGVRKHKVEEKDSLYFINCRKEDARDYVLKQADSFDILIINEAHHVAQHRMFTKSLLQELYNKGYRYLGLEALADTGINNRKFPVMESGYYTKEPEFGNLLSEALKIGFIAFGYEASAGKNGKEREIEQAENIEKFIKENQEGKVLIHCGYAHAYENDYPAWGKAMAGRLKENLNIDPLTIDQTMFPERSDEENNHLFLKMNTTGKSIVLLEENGRPFNGFAVNNQTDIVVIPPQTVFEDRRPHWIKEGKHPYSIPRNKLSKDEQLLFLAYRENEFDNNGVPADLIEVLPGESPSMLYLEKGKYDIIIKNRNYNIIEKYKIVIE